jgi:hypothetical protein
MAQAVLQSDECVANTHADTGHKDPMLKPRRQAPTIFSGT